MIKTEFIDLALSNRFSRVILERLVELDALDCWLVSGALFQPAWNALTNRAPDYGIKDYDILYFDDDTSWEAEDRVIKGAVGLFADLGVTVEVRNQARVHLWYEQKFGTPYAPLKRSTDAIDRFLIDCSMVGIRAGSHEIYAPKGFADIASMTIRPNRAPNFHPARYREKAERWRELWPELTILPA